MKNYKLKINGNDYSVDINEVEGQEIKLEVNGKPYTVTIDQELQAHQHRTTVISDHLAPRVSAAHGDVQRASAPKPGAAAGGTKVTTPLPGTILDVFVNVGDQVKSGQTVVLLRRRCCPKSMGETVDDKIRLNYFLSLNEFSMLLISAEKALSIFRRFSIVLQL